MEFLDTEFLGNPTMEWLIALAWALGGVITGRLVYRWFSRRMKALAAKSETKLDDMIVDQVEEPLSLSVVLLGLWCWERVTASLLLGVCCWECVDWSVLLGVSSWECCAGSV